MKLLRKPEKIATLLGVFESVDDAAQTVSAITAAGITPAALEMLDGWTLRTVEAFCHAGYPLDAGAVLLIELEGLREAVEEQADAVTRCMPSPEGARGAPRQGRRGARAAVERPQDGFRRARAGEPFVLHAGWGCAAQQDSGGCSTSETWPRNTT